MLSSHQWVRKNVLRRVAILNGGSIILSGAIRFSPDLPAHRLSVRIAVTVRGVLGARGTTGLRGRILGWSQTSGRLHRPFGRTGIKDPLLSGLLASGASVETFLVIEPTLEEIFVEKVGNAV